MSIKGLTDRGLAFPELGHIRKGASKTPKQIGADLTYFRVEFDDADQAAANAFLAAYPGGKPTDLKIVLPFHEIDRVWDAWLEAYTAGRMIARADGEYFTYLVDTSTGDAVVINGQRVDDGKPEKYVAGQMVGRDYNGKAVYCKPVGRLKVVLPCLERLGYLTLTTGSKHDIINISNQLRAIEALCQQVGKIGIGGVPLQLRRRMISISCPEVVDGRRTAKRIRRNKSLISIEADPEFVKRALMQVKHLALPGNGLALPQPNQPAGINDVTDFEEDDPSSLDEDPTEYIEAEATTQPEESNTEQPVADSIAIAELVKDAIVSKIKASSGRGVVALPQYASAILASVLTNTLKNDTDRYAVCRYLVGVASTKDMTAPQLKAMLEWQNVSGFDQPPTDEVIKQTFAVLEAANAAAGQGKLL